MTRRRLRTGGLVVAALAVGVGLALISQDEPRQPQALRPATHVIASSGPSGVVWIRDGAVVRVDQQSPPRRMVIPAPRRAPRPDGLAVGRNRVWVSSEGLVRGYGQGGRTVRAFRVTPRDPLLLAEGTGRLWASTPGTPRILVGNLTDRPLTFHTIQVPFLVRDLDAVGNRAWAMGDAPRARTSVVEINADTDEVTEVAELPGRTRGMAIWLRTLWVLTSEGLHRLDIQTGKVEAYSVVPGSTEVAAGPGRGLTLDPETGVVLDRTLGNRVYTYDVGAGARALVGARRGFWVSTGREATPRFVLYRGPTSALWR